MVLAAQDEVATLPYHIPMRNMDVKIGGNEFDRLRRWYKQGKLSKSRGIVRSKFPQTSSPRMIAKTDPARGVAKRPFFSLSPRDRNQAA